ncbi:MAG: DEAD/DEAH box helicase [Pirellulales bacterium]
MNISTSKIPLDLNITPFVTGWHKAANRPPRITFLESQWNIDSPTTVGMKIPAQIAIRVRSFNFADSGEPNAHLPHHKPNRPRKRASSTTRISPPKSLVKLEQRLSYLLQPPLEDLLGQDSLSLPFEPFAFQYEGIAFLYPRFAAVLADEMGLGKTMQAITGLRLLFHGGHVRRALLICPKPLVTNWQREFELWAPEIPVSVIQGNQATRNWQWSQESAAVTLANYELVARDHDTSDRIGKCCNPYDLVILDESQRIKNRGGKTAQVIQSIPRRRSWALTGTPVENSADDLVGIFDFVSPGLLSPGMKPRQMTRAIRDFALRRTKDQVLDDLPPKMINDAEIDLTAEQRKTYRRAEDEGVIRLASMGRNITVTHVFELILRLKQICNFDPATGSSTKADRLLADIEEIARSGQKAIVFSQWVATLEELAGRLTDFRPEQYHGKIPHRRRDAAITRFRDDPRCSAILMSYGAGGVGLNLQFASYVFLFDRWWNPAVEDQAVNRAHRIGVTRPVTVCRFISTNTIEERINQILESKREIFDTIFSNGAAGPANLGMSQEEILGLFNLVTPEDKTRGAA